MPKTPVHKNTDLQLGKYNVRLPWKVFAMKAEAITVRVKKTPDGNFRLGVTPLDSRHHSGSCLSVNDVHFVISQNSVVS